MPAPSSLQPNAAPGHPPRAAPRHVLLIDNYDSFTYNLVQLLQSLGADVRVVKNDVCEVNWHAQALLLSPGPRGPADAGVCLQALDTNLPCLGICLGHQVLAHRFGARVSRASRLLHGKACNVIHDGSELFKGVPQSFEAARYNSLIVKEPVPKELCVTARDEVGEVMALKHRHRPLYGIQFHPESILSSHGRQVVRNWLETL